MKIKITKDTSMGELIEKVPQSIPVIQKYFHGGCYQCPSMKMETLEMAAVLHGHDIDKIVAEIEKLIKE
jgi:hybrid cluster-associated redox disulfide protein